MNEEKVYNEEVNHLVASIEAVLFVAGEPITAAQIASALGVSTGEVEDGIEQLISLYEHRGLAIQRSRNRIQLTSSPKYAEVIENFLGLEASAKLSRAALETLTILAYRQPITRPRIDSIRGVSSDGVLRTLISKGLIEELGRAEGPGRPILYGTSNEFLQHFGLNSIDELPEFTTEEELTEADNLLKD